MVKPKTKKMVIYEIEETGSYFLRAMRRTDDPKGFATKDEESGKSISTKVNDAELGKAVREILKKCD